MAAPTDPDAIWAPRQVSETSWSNTSTVVPFQPAAPQAPYGGGGGSGSTKHGRGSKGGHQQSSYPPQAFVDPVVAHQIMMANLMAQHHHHQHAFMPPPWGFPMMPDMSLHHHHHFHHHHHHQGHTASAAQAPPQQGQSAKATKQPNGTLQAQQTLTNQVAPTTHLGGGSGYNRVPTAPKQLGGQVVPVDVEEAQRETRKFVSEAPVFAIDRTDPSRPVTVRYALPRPKPATLPMRPKG